MTTRRKTQPAEPIEEAADTTTEALKQGAAAGAEAAASTWPAVAKAISTAVYGTCYYAAYGATFGALSVVSLIPRNSVLEKGFHDGAEAARETFQEREAHEVPATAEKSAGTASAH